MLLKHRRNNLLRICAVVSTTQLLPLIHILRHQPEENCQDILIWDTSVMGESAEKGAILMQAVAESYPFAATYRLKGFKISTPRTAGRISWPFQFLLRHRHDSRLLRNLLLPHLKDSPQIEIWTDEPIHFPMMFLHGMFPTATHVKIPHAFNLENGGCIDYRNSFLSQRIYQSGFFRKLLWKLNDLISNVKYDKETGLTFDRAYTFDHLSCWSNNTIDLSHTIVAENLKNIYELLPLHLKLEVEEKIVIASNGSEKKWILLLLFGLNNDIKNAYRKSINRIFRESPEIFSNHQLVLKPHPVGRDDLLIELIDELSLDLSMKVTAFDCRINLDILWHLIPANIVLAGPCGALPIIKRLGISKPLVLKEIMDELLGYYPINSSESKGLWQSVEGIETI
ncbi:hypothetical protein IQ226_16790 [Dolichospermum sp. LEGE 00240]|uniref:hypothetical protein n=1 Tax=Dolichospermum sp. LEGE 00240 TaxID=1828603 RepID=UPI00188041AE|nr:hypothetical protein [Dolichospermum sp. LEGE 00240]MBE9250758.1 hypothetical protein [Dolichospermum sp. LEGE 00240]